MMSSMWNVECMWRARGFSGYENGGKKSETKMAGESTPRYGALTRSDDGLTLPVRQPSQVNPVSGEGITYS